MVLLRTKTGKKAPCKVHAYLPEYMLDYLNLYALAMGKFRSKILLGLVEDWYSLAIEDKTEEMLIDLIVENVQNQWEMLQRAAKTKSKYISFDDFLDQLETELSSGKKPQINSETAKTIIRILDEKNKR